MSSKIEDRLARQLGAMSLQITKQAIALEEAYAAIQQRDAKIAELEARLAASVTEFPLPDKTASVIAISSSRE